MADLAAKDSEAADLVEKASEAVLAVKAASPESISADLSVDFLDKILR